MLISARSISLRAAGILRPGIGGRVLASFERVCDLVTDAGEVVALVLGGIGDGPLNVVLAQGPGAACRWVLGFRSQERARSSDLNRSSWTQSRWLQEIR